MHLSATALIALLQAVGVDTLAELAPPSGTGRAGFSAPFMPNRLPPQGNAGDGNVRRALAA